MSKGKKNASQLTLDGVATNQQRLESYTGRKYDTETANGLTKAIVDTISAFHGYATRINCGGMYHERKKRDEGGNWVIDQAKSFWTQSQGDKGVSDIIAIYKGQYIAIEIKIGRDRQSNEQKEFQRKVENAGGIYVIARNYDQFYMWWVSVHNKLKMI